MHLVVTFRGQVLLGLAKSIFEEQTSLKKLVNLMMSHARNYLLCRRIALYVFARSTVVILYSLLGVKEADFLLLFTLASTPARSI